LSFHFLVKTKLEHILHWCKKFVSAAFLKKVFRRFHVREQRIFYAAGVIFLISFIVLLGQLYVQNTEMIAVVGGEYIEGVVGQPTVINPLLTQGNDVDRDIIELVFSGLLKNDGRGGTKLDLAEKIVVDEEGLVWTIFIKDNVFWHDGERFDADDVLFTIEAVQDPETGSHLFNSWQGVVAERKSTFEVELYLRSRYAAFEESLKELKIIPKHIYESIPRANYRLSSYNLEPIGTGPFRFKELQKKKDGFITVYSLERNTTYHQATVFLESLRLQFFQNEAELMDAFNAREIDGFGNARPQILDDININAHVLSFNLPRYFAIFLNQNISKPLQSSEVRQALRLATDKHSLLKFVFNNYGEIANGPIINGMLAYDSSFQDFTYNINEAQVLLEEAGWKFELSSSTIVRSDGEALLEFDLIVPDTKQLMEAAQLIQNNWEKIGVRVNIVQAALSEIADKFIQDRTYDMLLFGNIVNFNTDLFAFWHFWHSSQRFHPGLNLALFDNQVADELIESSRQSLDEQARVEDLHRFFEIIQEEVPAIFLFSPDYLYVTNNTLHGIEKSFILTPSERFSQVDRWWVKEARVFK